MPTAPTRPTAFRRFVACVGRGARASLGLPQLQLWRKRLAVALALTVLATLNAFGQAADQRPALPRGAESASLDNWLQLLDHVYGESFILDDPDGILLVGNARFDTQEFELLADAIGAYRVEGEDGTVGYRVVAVGNILLVRQGQSFRAETLFYDHLLRRAVLTQVRVRLDIEFLRRPAGFSGETDVTARDRLDAADDAIESELRGRSVMSGDLTSMDTPEQAAHHHHHHHDGRLVLAARELRMEDFARFQAQGIQVTTCDFGDPHWSIEADSATVVQIPKPEGDDSPPQYRADLSSTDLQVGDTRIPFLPSLGWDTRWNESIPLESLRYSRSSNFGNRIDSLWKGKLLIPPFLRPHVDLSLRLEYLSERGVGYGAESEWGRKPGRWSPEPGQSGILGGTDIYGTGTFYGINDRGEDANDIEPETNERNRARIHQRLRLPWGTLVDLEYAVERDSNFLLEYFESEFRGEKEPENLIYVRQPISELSAVTLLAKQRKVPYRTVVERLPELSFFLVEQPLGTSGFDLDVAARGSYLRFLPANNLPLNSQRMARGDIRTTLAYVLGSSKVVKLRPFFETRFTAWEEDEVRGNSIERLALATGARAAVHVSRVFPVEFLGYDALKHVIDPEISYRLVFENNVDPIELFRYDATEDVARREAFTFTLRNFLFGRRASRRGIHKTATHPASRSSHGQSQDHHHHDDHDHEHDATTSQPTIERLMELEIEVDYFPDPGRDNNRDPWSPIRSELLLHPYPGIGYFIESQYDVEDGPRFIEFNQGIQVQAYNALLGLGTRYRQHSGHFITSSLTWQPSDKFLFDGFYSYDFRREELVNQEYSLIRNFHRWSVLFTLEVDEGEDDNVTFSVRIGPRELWDAVRGRR